jgi:DNA repair photolyase
MVMGNLTDPFYTSKGKAAEYSDDLSLNVFHSCNFACAYCYVPGVLRTTKENYMNNYKTANNIVTRVERFAPKYKGRKVFLSFIGDFFAFDREEHASHIRKSILNSLIENDISVKILTKGNVSDYFETLELLPSVEFGTTITSLDLKRIQVHEPFALNSFVRLNQLKRAKDLGFKTWISLEPIIYPDEVCDIIEKTYDFTDFYYLGKLNYFIPYAFIHSEKTAKIKWNEYYNERMYSVMPRAVELLKSLNKDYIVKNETLVYLSVQGLNESEI